MTCRVFKLARRPYYRWQADPFADAEIIEAYRAHACSTPTRRIQSSGIDTSSRRPAMPGRRWPSGPPGGSAPENKWWSAFGAESVVAR